MATRPAGNLILEPTATAQWHKLVRDAQAACGCSLEEELESYLTFLLMRFVERPDMAAAVLAVEYLDGLVSAGRLRRERLRDVGDKCLLYSGLFPRRAQRKRVRVGYFVRLGTSAYRQLADGARPGEAALFGRLAEGFVAMMDVLQSMRSDERLDPLAAHELWADTGSPRARRRLSELTAATPLAGPAGAGPHRH
ncbi:hypothetical protein [Inmirania thermothiophila]|uniref:Uncharacterized protein n=1 Tax=Inmirania thermothiophila TaxID=1750597 RepID=A0A3N1Y5U5_9GAMM|nr:hypothetical protein [Inmirania thermothiophila]ROR34186.1 hypothetical protein EDC57_0082 [Inmirania thermothiophila]